MPPQVCFAQAFEHSELNSYMAMVGAISRFDMQSIPTKNRSGKKPVAGTGGNFSTRPGTVPSNKLGTPTFSLNDKAQDYDFQLLRAFTQADNRTFNVLPGLRPVTNT